MKKPLAVTEAASKDPYIGDSEPGEFFMRFQQYSSLPLHLYRRPASQSLSAMRVVKQASDS